MKYKHLVIFASIVFLGIFNITNASVLSDSFIKLLNIQSMSSTAHVNYSFKNGLTGDSRNSKGIVDLLLSGNQDISTPNKAIASQDFNLSIESSDFNLNLAISTKMIGDTLYIKIPDVKFDEFIPELVPYKNQWIKISKEDVDYLEPQFPGIKESYEKTIKVNSEPSVIIDEVSQIIKRYSYAFILKKTGSRIDKGVNQDKYTVTFSKKRLSNLLVADFTKLYKLKKAKDKKELANSINESLASVNFRNGILYIGQNDGLPYEISFTIDQLKNKKVISTLKVNLTFSQFGSHFDNVVIAPSNFVTLTNLYNQAFKPKIEEAKKEAEKMSLKVNLSSYFVWNETVYDEMDGKYGTMSNDGSCINPTLGSVFNKPMGDDLENSEYCNECSAAMVKKLIELSGNEKRCYSTTDAYAVQMSYKDNSGYYCIDSTGERKETTNLITGPVCGN